MAKSTLTDLSACVAEFHDAFQIGNNQSPNRLSTDEQVLRYSLMREENEEYLEAAQQGNLIEIADALGDQLYILLGTALRHGLMDKMEAIFLEIHRSNMSKLDAEGKPIFREDGKVLKSDRYFRPNIAAFFREDELGL
ncbi:MAG: nucleoside triphosphate pyrophosphohydrolase family protein [Bacteroidetes bacterium]|jgi:predicted HAD superfamily Cof-like phosphohydrolase|nr:nucleoside triphosphate pyrophosphohydrolase family protein [Bacteroidota bacterium]